MIWDSPCASLDFPLHRRGFECKLVKINLNPHEKEVGNIYTEIPLFNIKS